MPAPALCVCPTHPACGELAAGPELTALFATEFTFDPGVMPPLTFVADVLWLCDASAASIPTDGALWVCVIEWFPVELNSIEPECVCVVG